MIHILFDDPPDLSQPDYPPTCHHRPPDARELGYVAWHAMAAQRTRNGETQVYCKTCERWAWRSSKCPEIGA